MIFNWLDGVSTGFGLVPQDKATRRSRPKRSQKSAAIVEHLEVRQMLTPVIAGVANTTVQYAPSTTPVLVAPGITLTDSTSATIASAKVRIAANYVSGEDVLSFTAPAGSGITGTYSAGTLSLTGTATVAQYQAALASVTYVDTSANPTPTIRKLSYSANNGSQIGKIVDSYVQFTSLISNVEPATFPYVAGSGPAPITNTLTLASTPKFVTGATVQISGNYVQGQDVMAYPVQIGNITGSFDASTGTLTLSGQDTATNYQAALRSITYNNTSASPNTAVRQFTFTADGATNPAFAVNRSFSIPTAPVISNVSSNPITYAVSSSGSFVSTTLTLSDLSSTTLSAATVKISANFSTGDVLALGFTDGGKISGTFNPTTGALKLTGTDTLAMYQQALRSVTFSNTTANPSSSVRRISLTVNDGTHISTTVVAYANLVSLFSSPPNLSTPYVAGTGPQLLVSTLPPLYLTANGDISGMSIQISANYVKGQDVMSFSPIDGITGSFNTMTGTLKLTGKTTVANYETALSQNVFYLNENATSPSTLIRKISFTADGATNAAYAVNSYLNIVAGPMVAVGAQAGPFYTGGPGTAVAPNLTLSDPAALSLTGATVQIVANYVSTEDTLALGFTDGGTISSSWNASNGTLTLSGTDTVAMYQQALQSVTYQDTNVNPSPLIRKIAFAATDTNGSTSVPVDQYMNLAGLFIGPPGLIVAPPYIAGSGIQYLLNNDLPNLANPDEQITGMSIQLSANYAPQQDVLSYGDTLSPIFDTNIVGNWNAATGTLTLSAISGTDSVFDFGEALYNNVLYQNTSDAPSTAIRKVTFTADGATNPAFAAQSYFNVVVGPTISNVGTSATFTASGNPVAVTPSIVVNDANPDANGDLTGATIQISANYVNGEDLLVLPSSATDGGTISSSFNATNGTLTLSGTDTLANYQAALEAITYQDNSVNPTPNIRRLTIAVIDGNSTVSPPVDQYVNISSLMSGVDTADTQLYIAGTGGGTATAVLPNSFALAATSTGDISGATVQITKSYVSGEDVVSYPIQVGNITGNFDANTGTLTLSGSDTVANYLTALNSITYQDTSATPTSSVRQIAITVDGATNAAFTAYRYFNVASTPAISNVSTTPGTYYASGVPTAVAPGITVTDPNSPTLSSATVTINANYSAGDTLTFTPSGNVTGTFSNGTLSLSGLGSVAQYQAVLQSVMFSNSSANPASNIRRFILTINDGISSSSPVGTYISISSLMSGVGTANTVSYVHGSTATAVLPNTFTLAPSASGNISTATVQITGNYVSGQDVLALGFNDGGMISAFFNATTGTLTLSGADTVAAYQQALQSVTFFTNSTSMHQRQIAITVNGATNPAFTGYRYISVS